MLEGGTLRSGLWHETDTGDGPPGDREEAPCLGGHGDTEHNLVSDKARGESD